MAEQSDDACKQNTSAKKPAKIQTALTRRQTKGPVITREMFDKWTPDLLGIPHPSSPAPQPPTASTRPVRSSRNPNPQYIDAINCHYGTIGA